ncbi:MAG: ribonuclease E inhibitor RraB [Bacteroidia bacterium]
MKILIIFFLILTGCNMEREGRFFTKTEFENELNQNINIDVLRRIKNDSTITQDEMVFSFWFITDKRAKIDSLIDYFEENEPNQPILELNKINEIWELNGRTYPVKLEIESINNWESRMWEIGYKFDCRLDGWETTDRS